MNTDFSIAKSAQRDTRPRDGNVLKKDEHLRDNGLLAACWSGVPSVEAARQRHGQYWRAKIIVTRADATFLINNTNRSDHEWIAEDDLKTGQWKIEYRSQDDTGEQVCRIDSALRPVTCSADYEERTGDCIPRNTSNCGSIAFNQTNGQGADNSVLSLKVTDTNGFSAKHPPRVTVSPLNTIKSVSLEKDTEAWSKNMSIEPGEWNLTYFAGSEVCKETYLKKVKCQAPRYTESDGICVETEQKTNPCNSLTVKYQNKAVGTNRNFAGHDTLHIVAGNLSYDDYKLKLVPKTQTTPLNSSVQLLMPAAGDFALMLAKSSSGEEWKCLDDMRIIQTCKSNQVQTDDQLCADPLLKVSVSSTVIAKRSYKATQYLKKIPPDNKARIQLSPGSNYGIEPSVIVTQNPQGPWLFRCRIEQDQQRCQENGCKRRGPALWCPQPGRGRAQGDVCWKDVNSNGNLTYCSPKNETSCIEENKQGKAKVPHQKKSRNKKKPSDKLGRQKESSNKGGSSSKAHEESSTCHHKTMDLEFDVTGRRDSEELTAVLNFTALAGDKHGFDSKRLLAQAEDSIRVNVTVVGTASLKYSTMTISSNSKQVSITKGQIATIEIEAKDDEDLPIRQGNGRFITLNLQPPRGKTVAIRAIFDEISKKFVREISSADLEEEGSYSIWVDSVFEFKVVNDTSLPKDLSLPTRNNPRKVTVVPTVDAAKTTGIIVGASLPALLALVFLVYWLRYSPQSEKIRATRKVHVYRMLANRAQHHPDSGSLQLERRARRNPFSQILPWQQRRAHRANEIVLAELFHEKDGSGTADIHQEQLHIYVADVVTRRQYTALHCAALCNVDLEIVES